MSVTIGLLLALSFGVSLAALAFLIWAITQRQLSTSQEHAYTIFTRGEAGTPDDAAFEPDPASATDRHHFDVARAGIDKISRLPVLVLLAGSVFWLILGSIFGLTTSLKLHWPDWLNGDAVLTFGRIRTLHLNLVIYGWLSLAGIGVAMWVTPRIFHTALCFPSLPLIGAALWNIGVLAGAAAIASGWTDGEEWLEIPWQIDIILAVAGSFFVLPLLATAASRNVDHIYVSGWYYLGALCWFPVLFVIANFPFVHSGVEEATVNWWFAHNVLGLWLTPLVSALRTISSPRSSASRSTHIVCRSWASGAWQLFYSQVGIHHLIGGPVPTWVATLSIVHSIMMFVPVIAVAVNQHVTVARNWWAVQQSVPLRFISLAGCRTAVFG